LHEGSGRNPFGRFDAFVGAKLGGPVAAFGFGGIGSGQDDGGSCGGLAGGLAPCGSAQRDAEGEQDAPEHDPEEIGPLSERARDGTGDSGEAGGSDLGVIHQGRAFYEGPPEREAAKPANAKGDQSRSEKYMKAAMPNTRRTRTKISVMLITAPPSRGGS
jgi:hypothetical protein